MLPFCWFVCLFVYLILTQHSYTKTHFNITHIKGSEQRPFFHNKKTKRQHDNSTPTNYIDNSEFCIILILHCSLKVLIGKSNHVLSMMLVIDLNLFLITLSPTLNRFALTNVALQFLRFCRVTCWISTWWPNGMLFFTW